MVAFTETGSEEECIHWKVKLERRQQSRDLEKNMSKLITKWQVPKNSLEDADLSPSPYSLMGLEDAPRLKPFTTEKCQLLKRSKTPDNVLTSLIN